MKIDDLRKTTKDNPVTFMSKKWMHYDCDMGLLEDKGEFDKLKGKGKLMLAYVDRASIFGTIVKWFFPLSDYSFDVICDYVISKQVLREDDDIDIDSLSFGDQMSFIQSRLSDGASLFSVPILMQEVGDLR